MKTRNQGSNYRTLNKTVRKCALLGALLGASYLAPSLEAQIFVTSESNVLGSYNFDGTPINSSLVSGLSAPYSMTTNGSTIFVGNIGNGTISTYGISGEPLGVFSAARPIGLAISGNILYAANDWTGSVSTYNATTGALITANFITGLGGVTRGMAIDSAGNLYVASSTSNALGDGSVGKYNATTGATIDSGFISGLSTPFGIAIDGNNLYVSNFDYRVNTIGKYNLLDGSTINAAFITDIGNPAGLAIYDGSLYAASYSATGPSGNSVGQFSTVDGSAIDRSFITGINYPLAIVAVPEPGTVALLALGGMAILAFRMRKNS
jgi:hypothetical protein